MKSSMRDKAEGAFHEAKDKVKEMAGKITDNPTLEAKGKAENIAGKLQEKVGQVKKVLKGRKSGKEGGVGHQGRFSEAKRVQ